MDLETLKKVNADLISTIEETIKIQQEGRIARQNAEAELAGIEEQLKHTLLATAQSRSFGKKLIVAQNLPGISRAGFSLVRPHLGDRPDNTRIFCNHEYDIFV